MKLTFEANGHQSQLESPQLLDVEAVVNNLNSSYVILENENGDYIQCAGTSEGLVVEVRFYYQDSFKHFILGTKDQSKVWHTIHGNIGPIRVLGHEKLKVSDARELFKYFYSSSDVLPSYNKRNITKQFN